MHILMLLLITGREVAERVSALTRLVSAAKWILTRDASSPLPLQSIHNQPLHEATAQHHPRCLMQKAYYQCQSMSST